MSIDYKADKKEEFLRYDRRAQTSLEASNELFSDQWGSQAIPLILRAPYLYFEKSIHKLIAPQHKVLELCSGTGLHTYSLLQTGADVTASDISPRSLELLEKKLKKFDKREFRVCVADIENLPFDQSSFDFVTCAGSLSYGDPRLVDAEIRRVLKPGGTFICVDSLHHNPVYKLNRWIHYWQGRRTKATLKRMPKQSRIDLICQGFEKNEVKYFGSLSWAMMVLAKLVDEQKIAYFSDSFDQKFKTRLSAYKFVLIASGCNK